MDQESCRQDPLQPLAHLPACTTDIMSTFWGCWSQKSDASVIPLLDSVQTWCLLPNKAPIGLNDHVPGAGQCVTRIAVGKAGPWFLSLRGGTQMVGDPLSIGKVLMSPR